VQFEYSPYIVPLLIAGASSIWVAYYAWSHRGVSGAFALGMLAVAAGIWTVGYALEVAGADLATKVFWSKIEYLGVTTVPILWLIFCYNYFNQDKQLPWRFHVALGVVPLITLLLVFTTESHGMVWSEYHISQEGGFSCLKVTHGPWFNFFWVYSQLLVLVGTFFIIRLIRHKHGLYRGQIQALIAAAAVPWVGNLLYFFGWTAKVGLPRDLDPTSFGFAVAVVFMALGIFRFQLMNLVPLARDTVVEAMESGMMVIDTQGRVVDINRAALNLINLSIDQVIHRPATEVLGRWPHLTAKYAHVSEALDEISVGEGEHQRWFELGLSPLRNKNRTVVGRLITLRDVTLKIQAEERIRHLSRAVDASPVSIIVTGVDGQIQYVNPKFTAVTGYSLPEVLGQNPRLLKTDQTPAEVYRQLWETITSGREWHGEFCNRKKNGELYWETTSISPIFDAGGHITNYVALKEDVTEQRRMREQLQVQNKYFSILHEITIDLLNRRERNDLLQAIVNHAADLLNAPYGEIMLKEGEELVVYSFTKNQDFLSVDRVDRSTAKLAWKAHDTGQPAVLDDYSVWPDRRAIYDRIKLIAVADFPVIVEDRCVAVIGMGRSRPGQVFTPEEIQMGVLFSRLVGLVLDSVNLYDSAVREVAERKRTEILLQDSEARYRQIVENADELIYRTNADGYINYVNASILRLFGLDALDDILGKHYLEFVVPNWRAKAQRFYVHQFLSGELNTYLEFPITSSDGHELWLGQNVRLIRDGDQVAGFQAVARDITAIKQAQEALSLARDQAQQASHFKGDLLARVSHELRTPLAGIMGYAELLRDEALGPLYKDQKQAVETIAESTEFLSSLINDLMDQAQIEAKKLVLHFGDCSPRELLENLEEMMGVQARKRGLTLQTILEPGVPDLIYGDEQRLRQILINLVANAIKFTRQGEVCVRISQPDPNHWTMQVSDTGIGIPQEVQTIIFEPFQKAAGSLTRDNRGIGLGLSIAKQLIELMDGRIVLTSEVGKGSTFLVTLPITKSSVVKPFALIVEDDPKVGLIYQMTLQQMGFDTALDMNGNQYMAMLADVMPALIVLDLHMPFANGVDILRQVRSDQRLAAVPVIVTTADLFLAKSIQGQAEEILIKPVSVAHLRETVFHIYPGNLQEESQDRMKS
jgi:PAS domain S-box-containing protein